MAFYKSTDYGKAIQKVTINFGTRLGLEKDEDAYITLKELPTLETMELKEAYEAGELKLMKYFKEVMPSVLVDHNLWVNEEKKMSNKEVVDFLFEKLDLTSKIISEYTDAVFTSRLNNKEEK